MTTISMYTQPSFPSSTPSAPYLSNTEVSNVSQPQPEVMSKAMTLDPSLVPTTAGPALTTDNDADLRAGGDSPDTDILEISAKPDLTIFCSACELFIDLRALTEHRIYHKSLEIMHYRHKARPLTVDGLLKRRKNILKKMKKETHSESPLDPSELQKLNDAFEFLKTDLEDTYEEFRQIRENVSVNVRGLALNCSAKCADAVGICSDANPRWKNCMEDSRVFQDFFGNDPNKCFFGIYDGHHGQFAAEVAARELHHALLMEMEKFDPRTKCTCTYNLADEEDLDARNEIHSRAAMTSTINEKIQSESASIIQHVIKSCEERLADLESNRSHSSRSRRSAAKSSNVKKKEKDPFVGKMSEAFRKAYKYTDILLSWGKDEMSKVRWSGCSTLTCVIQSSYHGDDNHCENNPGHHDIKVSGIDDKQGGKKYEEPKQLGILYLANAGNVKGVLVRGNRAYCVSREHTPHNIKERSRVLREGGTVTNSEKDELVNGVLATTRGLGNHGDPLLKRCILVEPYTTSIVIDQYAQFLILASNGIWEVFSEQEAASLLLQVLPSNHVPAPSTVSTTVQRLLDGPQSEVSTECPSEVATDYIAANRKHNEKVFGAYFEDREPDKQSILRPRTGQSQKSKSNVSIILDPLQEDDTNQSKHQSAESAKTPLKEAIVPKSSTPTKLIVQTPKLTSTDPGDMTTEIGSQFDGFSEKNGNESGNEADIDTTLTEVMTLPSLSRASDHAPTRAEVQRDYAKLLSERLVQAALMAGAKDNLTAMVILLPGSGL